MCTVKETRFTLPALTKLIPWVWLIKAWIVLFNGTFSIQFLDSIEYCIVIYLFILRDDDVIYSPFIPKTTPEATNGVFSVYIGMIVKIGVLVEQATTD